MESAELIDRFKQFYHTYYRNEIGELAQNYPSEQRSLYISWNDLHQFDADLADDYRAQPDPLQEYAEEALRVYDLPIDVGLDQAHVRIDLDDPTEIGQIRARQHDQLMSVRGITREVTDVRSKIQQAAFECQRCGTLARIPQTDGDFQEPCECQGCERQDRFNVNTSQSEFVDSQELTLIPLLESGSATENEITVRLKDDITGETSTGDRIRLTGVLRTRRQAGKSTVDIYLDDVSIISLGDVQAEFWDAEYLDDALTTPLTENAIESFATRTRAILTTQDLDEFGTQTKIISPFIHLLGWNLYHPEVILEHSSDSLNSRDRADYALLDERSNYSVIIEAKQEGTRLNNHTGQLKRYMRIFGAELGMLTNGERYLFLCSDPDSDSPREITVLDCKLEDLSSHLGILEAYTRRQRSNGDAHESLHEIAEANKESDKKDSVTNSGDQDTTSAEVSSMVSELEESNGHGVPVPAVLDYAEECGPTREVARDIIESLQHEGKVYEPKENPPSCYIRLRYRRQHVFPQALAVGFDLSAMLCWIRK